MKIHLLCALIVAFGLTAMSTGGIAARGAVSQTIPPQFVLPEPNLPPNNHPDLPGAADRKGGPLPGSEPFRARPANLQNAAVAVGQPGLSFRYEHTFGVTEQAYPADTQHLNGPRGLFIDATNNIFVVEDRGSRVLKYNAAGSSLLILGTAGMCYTDNYVFCQPQDMVTDSGGNLWVADGNRVVEYSPTGVFSQTLPASNSWESGSDTTHFNDVESIALNAGRLFVADWNNHRVQVYTLASGTPVYSTTLGVTGVSGNNNTHFNHPADLALDGAGRLYVADNGNNRVQRCTFSATWTCNTLDSGLNQPFGISVDANSNTFISDAGNGRVRKCTASGTCSTLISGIDGWPTDVATDSSGNIYVAANAADVVRKYNSAGVALGIFKGIAYVPYVADQLKLDQPRGIAVATDGSLYIGEANGYRLVKLNSDGTRSWAVGTAGVWGDDANHLNNWGGGIAIDSAGRIVVADTGNNRLKLFNPDGSLYSIFGQYGQGQYQFNCPVGVAVNPTNGDVVVVDYCDQRVQVYTSKYVYKATLGITGARGSDNTHFNNPWGVAVDNSGRIYVADSDNHRVQRCTLSGSTGTCSTFAGVTGVQGSDFGHFSHPFAIALDVNGRVYVSDEWNNRVQVFDSTGAYLTTIGGNWGALNGEMRNPEGIAVDRAGNLYVTDQTNHRVQKYALGVPSWQQVNVNGFGDHNNSYVTTLAPFSSYLYAATANWSGSGSQLWRSANGITWSAVMTNGFGSTSNIGIDHLAVFHNQLYAGTGANSTTGGELWRSGDGLNWTRVVSQGFGDPSNGEVFQLAVLSDTLYASTWSYTSTHGAEIWRSTTGNTGDWTRVVSNGFGTADTEFIPDMEVFGKYLYAGTYNYHWTSQPYTYTGAAVWRTDGNTWTKVSTDGFGSSLNYFVNSLGVFNGSLYVGISHAGVSTEIWRCQICDGNDWVRVTTNIATSPSYGLISYDNWLYLIGCDWTAGIHVLRTANGIDWHPVSTPGFGSSNNGCIFLNNSVAAHNTHLFIGTNNDINGGQLWRKTVTADFNVDNPAIRPGSTVTFTNVSAGDYLTSTWNFGDGSITVVTPTTLLRAVALTPTVNHVYAAPGIYTVTLTVDDGIDTNTITRTSAIQVGYRAYLPTVLRSSGTTIALYDDFNDASFNGFYNPLKWQQTGTSYFLIRQLNGTLIITNTSTTPASQGSYLLLTQPPLRMLKQVQQFEARLKLDSHGIGTEAKVEMQIYSDNLNGHQWWTTCVMGALNGMGTPFIYCDVTTSLNGISTVEYSLYRDKVNGVPISLDTWYTARTQIDPDTGQIGYYLNNTLLGSWVPSDAAALKHAANLSPRIGGWNGNANVTATRYVDDVKITPAQ